MTPRSKLTKHARDSIQKDMNGPSRIPSVLSLCSRKGFVCYLYYEEVAILPENMHITQ
jgi:hypothetical protein